LGAQSYAAASGKYRLGEYGFQDFKKAFTTPDRGASLFSAGMFSAGIAAAAIRGRSAKLKSEKRRTVAAGKFFYDAPFRVAGGYRDNGRQKPILCGRQYL